MSNHVGGNTKITLREALAIGATVVSLAIYGTIWAVRLDNKLDDTWTVRNQAVWQREYEKTGTMPDPFRVKESSATRPKPPAGWPDDFAGMMRGND